MAFTKKNYIEGQTVITAKNLNDINNFLGGGTGNLADYITEQGTNSGWLYRKWASGMVELWGKAIDMTTQSGWVNWSVSVPSGIYKSLQEDLVFAQNIYTQTDNREARKWVLTVSGGALYVRDGSGNVPADGSYVSVSIYAIGTWK